MEITGGQGHSLLRPVFSAEIILLALAIARSAKALGGGRGPLRDIARHVVETDLIRLQSPYPQRPFIPRLIGVPRHVVDVIAAGMPKAIGASAQRLHGASGRDV